MGQLVAFSRHFHRDRCSQARVKGVQDPTETIAETPICKRLLTTFETVADFREIIHTQRAAEPKAAIIGSSPNYFFCNLSPSVVSEAIIRQNLLSALQSVTHQSFRELLPCIQIFRHEFHLVPAKGFARLKMRTDLHLAAPANGGCRRGYRYFPLERAKALTSASPGIVAAEGLTAPIESQSVWVRYITYPHQPAADPIQMAETNLGFRWKRHNRRQGHWVQS